MLRRSSLHASSPLYASTFTFHSVSKMHICNRSLLITLWLLANLRFSKITVTYSTQPRRTHNVDPRKNIPHIWCAAFLRLLRLRYLYVWCEKDQLKRPPPPSTSHLFARRPTIWSKQPPPCARNTKHSYESCGSVSIVFDGKCLAITSVYGFNNIKNMYI